MEQHEIGGSESQRVTHSTAERNEMQRRESYWAFAPGIIGLALAAILAVFLLSRDPSTPQHWTSTDAEKTVTPQN